MRGFAAVAALAAALPVWAEVPPPADVVILGEVHDNPTHHAWQAEVVAAMAPSALVFEMLLPEQAALAGPERDDAAALAAALEWDGRGWPDYDLYSPILAAAPDALIVGGDVPHDDVRRAMEAGAAAVFGPEAARYGLTDALAPDDQAAREAEMDAAHCHALPAEMLPGMVEAQRLRDATLARAAIEAHAVSGGPVAVIAGTGHARRDRGVPAALSAAAPGLSVYSVGQFEVDPGPDAPFDRVIVTEPTPRDDPCAAFR